MEDTGERRYGKHPVFRCRCDCGEEREVPGMHLRSGHTRSCGCLRYASPEERALVPTGPNEESRLRLRYKKRYGLTLDEARAMLAKGCAICGSHDDLCIDHCHVEGKARSALCRKCNSMLGMADDAPARLRAAAEYLEAHGTVG